MAAATRHSSSEPETIEGNPAYIIANDAHPEILSYCSSGMPSHWYWAMRLKYANDANGMEYLRHHLMIIAGDIAARNKWRKPEGENVKGKITAMAELALNEMRYPARFRHECSVKIRCGWLQCDDSRWYRIWRARYEQLYQELEEWPNRAFRYMKISPQRIAKYREKVLKPFDKAQLNAYPNFHTSQTSPTTMKPA